MRDAEYLYKVWNRDYYMTRSNSDSPFYKTRKGAEKVAKRWGGVVHRFKITRDEL